MNVYIGLDVSLASTAICVLDEKGRIVTEAQVASTPDALVSFMVKLSHEIAAISLEAGPLGEDQRSSTSWASRTTARRPGGGASCWDASRSQSG